MLPLTCAFASANQNEKKHSLNMQEKTKNILKGCGAKLKRDSRQPVQRQQTQKRCQSRSQSIPCKPEMRRHEAPQGGQEVQNPQTRRPEKRVSQEASHRSGPQLPQDPVQHDHKQGQKRKKRGFLRDLQPIMPRSEQRSSRKHQKTDKTASSTYFNTQQNNKAAR
jgi:hypothetical protein